MRITDYKEGDENQILELFKLAFKKEMSIEYWNWRYKQNPFDNQLRIKLMWDGDLLVGHYAVSPLFLKVNNETCQAALSMTTMTHPNYTGKGIFKTLATELYNDLETNSNYRLIWGFPNGNSHYAFIKNLNWLDVNTIPMLTLSDMNFEKFKPIAYETVEQFTEVHANVLNSMSNKTETAVYKTVQYLNWRYISNPSYTYYSVSINSDPQSFIVFKIYISNNEIDIVEIGSPTFEFSFNKLIGAILSFTKDNNIKVNSINLWWSVFHENYQTIEKSYFTMNTPVTYLGYRPLKLLKSNIQPNKWQFSLGDSDVF